MKKNILIYILIVLTGVLNAQNDVDTSKTNLLLTNLRVQIECTEAMDSLYNGNFLVAEKQFGWLQEQYPDHPLGYFLMALSQRWKIMPNTEETKFDEKFFNYLEITIDKAKELYKEDKTNPEAAFFLACAYGLKGQRLEENDKLFLALSPSEKASDYIVKNLEISDVYGPEFLFGKGLYNFFREWIPAHKKSVGVILMTFRKGDTKLGLEQLNQTANSAFYTRIEALVYLMDIYSVYGIYDSKGNRDYQWHEAYMISKNLYNTYNLNKYFERKYAEICAKTGNDYSIAIGLIKKNLNEESVSPGSLDMNSLRSFSYFYAQDLWSRGLRDEAVIHYKKMIDCSLELDMAEALYTKKSYYNVGTYYKEKGDKDYAIKYLEYYVDSFDQKSIKYSKKEEKSTDREVKEEVNKKKEEEKKYIEAKNYLKNNQKKKFLGVF